MTEKASFLCSFDLHVIFAHFLSHDFENGQKHLQNKNKLRHVIFFSLLNEKIYKLFVISRWHSPSTRVEESLR